MKQEFNLTKKLVREYDRSLDHGGINGTRLAQRLGELSKLGLSESGGSNRVGFSKEERQAKELVKKWMRDAGLQVREDGAGNVFARFEGLNNDLPAILSGSHVDTVPNGGHFDGTLGVLAALEVVEAWKELGYNPVRPFEVVIFTDEEGARFNGGLTGSEAMMGAFELDKKLLLKDSDGMTFQQVLEEDGLSLDSYEKAGRDLDEIAAYVEVHIEQGKRLENANIPCGIVTGIAGPCWLEITFTGEAGHAGNTPMNDRKDALVAASGFIHKIHTLPRVVSETAVATVGKMSVKPNGVNVIPGEVQLYVDIRDIYESTRDKLVEVILDEAKMIARSHNVGFKWQETTRVKPVPIQDKMQEILSKAFEAHNIKQQYLPSGAGHDAMVLGEKIPVAMLFVRSENGISHNPREWTSLDDCVHSVHLLKHCLENLVSEV